MASNNQQSLDDLLKSLTTYAPGTYAPGTYAPGTYAPGTALQPQQTSPDLTYGTLQPNLRYNSNATEQYDVSMAENSSNGQYPNDHHYPTALQATHFHGPPPQRHEEAVVKTPQIDPRTIIAWTDGLRYVSHLIARYEEVGQRVRKMIYVQHKHEYQWWKGREALIEKQKARVEGDRKLEEVLRAVGAQAPTQGSATDEASELKAYDMKVYKAAEEMVKTMTEELGTMGIPFFGTKSELIVGDNTALQTSSVATTEASTTGGHTITRTELQKLQRRMLQHLEDMFKD